MFGAVMSTESNAGQVRGPLQMTFARSASPIVPLDVSITRMAVATEKEAEEQGGDNRTMGRKALIPYGLYRGHGFFSAPFAKQTGVSSADLQVFWEALMGMWDHDHSASRGLMSCRGLYVFSHENGLGNAPAHQLFDRLELRLRDGVPTPRRYADYVVTLNREMPDGVRLPRWSKGKVMARTTSSVLLRKRFALCPVRRKASPWADSVKNQPAAGLIASQTDRCTGWKQPVRIETSQGQDVRLVSQKLHRLETAGED